MRYERLNRLLVFNCINHLYCFKKKFCLTNFKINIEYLLHDWRIGTMDGMDPIISQSAPRIWNIILVIDKLKNENDTDTAETRHCLVSTSNQYANDNRSIGQKRFQNQGKNTVSSIIGSYKSAVTKHARKTNPNFAWQPRFHDHNYQKQ
ncbi:hypothetical protein ACFLQ5_00160 [Bacteroidota bacterium]